MASKNKRRQGNGLESRQLICTNLSDYRILDNRDVRGQQTGNFAYKFELPTDSRLHVHCNLWCAKCTMCTKSQRQGAQFCLPFVAYSPRLNCSRLGRNRSARKPGLRISSPLSTVIPIQRQKMQILDNFTCTRHLTCHMSNRQRYR